MNHLAFYFLIFLSFGVTGISSKLLADNSVTVYSARKEHLVKPVFKAFEEDTGIKVNYLTGKSPALLERIKAEGEKTRADVFMTVDAGNLWIASERGLFQEFSSPLLKTNIPEYLRDPSSHWFGFSIRARTIVYHPDRVKLSDLSTYEDLAHHKWKKRLCLRTSKKVYNQSLVAMLIEHMGEKTTESIIKSWVENLAVPVYSSDTRLMEGILAGKCDVGIVNSYYFGRIQKKDKDLPLKLFWPNQSSFGVHINISGAGITKNAKNLENAKKLLEWLSLPKAQSLFANLNMEYPANQKVEADVLVREWGDFIHSKKNVSRAGYLQSKAVRLMDRAGYE